MREDAPAGPSLSLHSKDLGIRPRGLSCKCTLATLPPVSGARLSHHLPILQRIAIASLAAAPAIAWTRFASCHPALTSGADHQGGTAALSCRLCLIACNSRQFDEAEPEEQVR
jgi:hypothetical protein